MLGLGRPDAFRGDPYGWLTNQMSHALCGLIGTWFLMMLGCPQWCAVAAAGLVSAMIEVVHLRRGGSLGDGITDLSYVVGGAAWQATGGSIWLIGIVTLDLAIGVRLRTLERGRGLHPGDR